MGESMTADDYLARRDRARLGDDTGPPARVRVTRRDDSAVVVVDGDHSLVIPGHYCR
jgi:hypothetical protein